MTAVTGSFGSRSDAEKAMAQMGSLGVPEHKIALLTPDTKQETSASRSVLASTIPSVGPVTVIGILGKTVLEAAAGRPDSASAGNAENSPTDGWPETELFVYEDALRKGRTVLIALSENESEISQLHGLLRVAGADPTDAAREQWWADLRAAESEHYLAAGGNFGQDEQFYRLGFESALHARMRCREYDQVLSEMAVKVEEVERQYPDSNVEEPFTKGYGRGRDHYERLCSDYKVA